MAGEPLGDRFPFSTRPAPRHRGTGLLGTASAETGPLGMPGLVHCILDQTDRTDQTDRREPQPTTWKRRDGKTWKRRDRDLSYVPPCRGGREEHARGALGLQARLPREEPP